MLRSQARILTPGANFVYSNRPSGDGGQRQRSAQYLATPLAVGTIND
jgi:hypothetical protein